VGITANTLGRQKGAKEAGHQAGRTYLLVFGGLSPTAVVSVCVLLNQGISRLREEVNRKFEIRFGRSRINSAEP
jgi:hypothetical protein